VAAAQRWLTAEVYRRSAVSFQVEKLSLQPLFTLSGRNAFVSVDNRQQPSIPVDELRLRPLWSSLVSGDPGLSLAASMLRGQLDAEIRRSGQFMLQVDGIELSDFPLNPETRTQFSGIIRKGEFRGGGVATRGAETLVSLQLEKSSISILGQPLALGKIVIQGKGRGNNLRIDSLAVSEGDLGVSGTGNLLVGASLAASRINLDLNLRPAPSAPPVLMALLDVAGQRQAGNDYRLKLSGTLGQLTVDHPAPPGQINSTPHEEEE